MSTLGRYEIIEQLGQGTMGSVYKARDPIMDREVAIKQILLQAIEGPDAAEFRERFAREARAAGKLAHPGIVTVFDVSEHEGNPFLVMEYIAGRTLQSILQSGERMDLDRVCDLGTQLAEALHYAHHNRVIHRDIKPANILVTEDGRTKITDFGIAKVIESQLTYRGQLLGTPAYMAPEQFTGMPIDLRADLYALGVVIYCMATGDKPFGGDTILSVQYRVVHIDPVPPRKLNPAISPDLEAVILKSIEKDPLKRYESGEELARDLRACRAGQAVRAQMVTTASENDPETATVRLDADVVAKGARGRRVNTAKRILIPLLAAVAALVAYPIIESVRHKTPEPPSAIVASGALNPESSGTSENVEPQTVLEVPELKPDPVPEVPIEVRSPEAPKNSVTRVESRANKQSNSPKRPVDEINATLVARDNQDIVSPTLVQQQDPTASYKSSRLLITSATPPEPMTIIVIVNNEVLFHGDAAATALLSEERALPPGKHKVQVNVLRRGQRIGKVQEVTDRFYSGQRRVLQVEFFPESLLNNTADRDTFGITLK